MPTCVRKKILIVGAGASGLPAFRHAQLYDVDATCFEASGEVGGLWSYKPHETDQSSVMKSTVINTSKEMTAYSDFPPEGRMANFMHNTEMHRYLKNYATAFGLTEKIKFHHKVTSVLRSDDYSKSGRWTVCYTDDKGVNHEETFDGVMLCSGHHTLPHMPPKYRGQEKFRGKIIHSHSYKDHRGYEDKIVVVVGIGNSGGDVAVELSRIAKKVYLVTRRGSWIFNRIFDYGEPMDLVLNRKFLNDLKNFVPSSLASWFIEKKLNYRFDHQRYGLKPQHRVFGAHPTVNDELPNRIACGTVLIKPNISQFSENDVIFEDGSVVKSVDEVVMSTGYSFEFKLLEEGNLVPVLENEVELYKYMFPLQTADKNTLAIIGLIQPYGSIMPLSEMQARVFFWKTVTGGSKLPTEAEMRKDVEKARNEMKNRYVTSRRHTIQVDYVPYIEDLAALVGCQVDMKKLLFSDPVLAYKVYFGPRVPYVYRLHGPHAWKNARQAICEVDERVRRATRDDLIISPDYSLLYALGVLLLIMGFLVFSF
ncbi:unnamed protein product [Caenorhabditis auriculariae]|uniref:Flavin-containing monooxygenase n=1 Tax=Caenorhabditis auriculariae TaxID=2777116 RepID=A0A8S1H8C5_9PELO|nr:unnamed protein product [Caenorhabditis auriculariae]